MSLPKLDFRVLSSSSAEISEGSINELKKPLSKSKVWHSSKYCTYPQNIYIAFDTPINLRQINLLSHEKKISEKISFYSYCPQGDISIKDYKTIPYLNFGYIKLNDNSENNYKAREFKKVFVDVKCLYLIIDFNKNYNNAYNPFNQVSLINIEFFGYKLPGYKNSLINIEITDENQEKLEDLSPMKNNNKIRDNKSYTLFLDEICGDKLKELNLKLSESTRNQNSNECFRIKECINEINNIGKKIYELQRKKNEAVNEENFDKAMEIKKSIDILTNQLNKIDINPKKPRSKRRHNSGNKNNSASNSGNNSFIDNDDNILEEIKEETENDIDNHNNYKRKKNVNNANNIDDMNSINNLNTINNSNDLNNYNITNYSNMSNNTKTLDLSQGRILSNLNTGRKNSIEFYDEEFYKQYDDRMVPAVKKRLQFNKTLEEIDQENEEIYTKELGPLEEITKEELENYDLLLVYIEEEGLRKILSRQYDFKIEGFKLLTNKLQEILESPDIENIIIILFRLIGKLFEDKKMSMNIKLLDLIFDIFKNISKNGNKITISRELDNYINDRILNKIIFKLNDSSEMMRKKAYDIIIFLLYSKILTFDLLINDLLLIEIKNKKNNYYIITTSSINYKLDIINSILKNYSKLINEGICTEENFPKNIIADYLIMHVTSSKNEIKNKCRAVMDLAIEVLGINIFRQKLIDFTLKDLEKLKIKNLKEIIDFLKEINNNLNLTSDYTMRESISRMNSNKPNEENRKKPNSGSRSRSKSKEENKNENYNKCSICKKQLGNDNIIEHMKKCVMCHQCKKCKIFVEFKNLKQHRLNECSKKDKFAQCPRCKEAIPSELYDEHVKSNKCNKYKKNCNRCPLCHEDIPLSKDAFFRHLTIDGCPYKIKYKKKEK